MRVLSLLVLTIKNTLKYPGEMEVNYTRAGFSSLIFTFYRKVVLMTQTFVGRSYFY
jgi:hypothetical protein